MALAGWGPRWIVIVPGSHPWHILTYRVPGEPTRLRATVWRRLKSAGAVYLAGSVAVLPASPSAERLLRRVRVEITGMGGSAQLLLAEAVAGEAGLIQQFNSARDEEYSRVIVACEDLRREIGCWAAAGCGTVADLDRAGRQFARLVRQHAEVTARDAFGAGQAHTAGAAVTRLHGALDGFAASVSGVGRLEA